MNRRMMMAYILGQNFENQGNVISLTEGSGVSKDYTYIKFGTKPTSENDYDFVSTTTDNTTLGQYTNQRYAYLWGYKADTYTLSSNTWDNPLELTLNENSGDINIYTAKLGEPH